MTGGCSLVVLAGGQSLRMGRDKACLPSGGQTMLERIVARLSPVVDEVIVAGKDDREGPVRSVSDRFAGAGPLAGIHAGLLASRFELAWVVACDYPDVEASLGALLRRSAAGFDAAVPRVGGRPQGVCALYRASLAPVVERLILSGRRSVRHLLESCAVCYLDESELRRVDPQLRSFRNLNTPAEYDDWLSSQPALP